MTSRQYNFRPQLDELEKFETYLESKGFVILTVPTDKMPFEKTNKVIHTNENYWPARYITKAAYLEGVNEQLIETQNHYLIDEITSFVIEISLPKQISGSENPQPGRVYFITGYYGGNNEWVEKDADFVKDANKVLQWCRRNFKNKY